MSFKRHISRILIAALAVGLLFLPVSHSKANPSDENISCMLDGERLIVYGHGQMKDYNSNEKAPWAGYNGIIKSVEVQDGVTSIGAEAFYNLASLISVELAPSVKSINTAAFANCKLLREFSAPGLNTVADYAFQNTAIKDFNIGQDMMSISDLAFYSADIGQFMVSSSNPVFSSEDGLLLDKTGTTLIRYPNGKPMLYYNVPEDVKTIGKYAFQGSTLNEIGLGNIIEIKESAFQACPRVSAIEIPASVRSIDEYAFYSCAQLNSLKLNEGLTIIKNSAFASSDNIETVTIPSTVEFVHHKAFGKNVRTVCLNKSLSRYGQNGYRLLDSLEISYSRNYDQAFSMLSKINSKRKSEGLSALFMSKDLLSYAMKRAAETIIYPSHTRPDSSDMASGFESEVITGVSEAIIDGQDSAGKALDSLVKGGKDLSGINSSASKVVGIGCVTHEGRSFWTVITGKAELYLDCEKPENDNVTERISIAAGPHSPTAIPVISIDGGEYVGPGKYAYAQLCTIDKDGNKRAVFNESDTIIWKSSDSSIASITSTGQIKGQKEGRATISATTKNGNITAEVTVSVGIGEATEMFRLYNKSSGEHLYTADINERDTLNGSGWEYEGIAWFAPKTSAIPVYRLYNRVTGDHHYTTDVREKNTLAKKEWNDEGICWYSDPLKGVPLYRLFKDGLTIGGHHYTTDKNERRQLVRGGWDDEGIAWYGTDPEKP